MADKNKKKVNQMTGLYKKYKSGKIMRIPTGFSIRKAGSSPNLL